MAKLVDIAVATQVENVAIPALFIISEGDTVVRPQATKAIAARWGATHLVHIVEDAEDPSQHVIAGDASSPGTTDELAKLIVDWVHTLPTTP